MRQPPEKAAPVRVVNQSLWIKNLWLAEVTRRLFSVLLPRETVILWTTRLKMHVRSFWLSRNLRRIIDKLSSGARPETNSIQWMPPMEFLVINSVELVTVVKEFVKTNFKGFGTKKLHGGASEWGDSIGSTGSQPTKLGQQNASKNNFQKF